MQTLQNTLCRIVCRLPWRGHVSKAIKSLHWLFIQSRIKFKTLVIIYKNLQCGEPHHLKEHLVPYTCPINTHRSNLDKQILRTTDYEQRIHSSFKQLSHSFAYSAPRLWNDLPLDIRLAKNILCFRKDLKTHQFSLAYPT